MSEPTVLTCAKCGEKKELCQSSVMDGVKQPRTCKECVMQSMKTDDWGINDKYWILQLIEQNETKSLETLMKQYTGGKSELKKHTSEG